MALILIFMFLLLVILILKPRRRLRNEPPLVPGHWFFGNAFEFSEDAVGFLLRSQKLYGDVFTLRLMNQHLTIIMDPHFYDQIGKHKNLSFDYIQQQVNWNVFGFAVHDTKALLKETGITMKGKHQTASLKSFIRNLEKSTDNLKGSMSAGPNKINLRPLVVSTLFSAIFNSIFGTAKHELFNSGLVHTNFEIFHRYFNFLWLGMPIWLFPEARKALINLHNMPNSETLLSRKDLSSYMRKAIEHLTNQNQTESEIRGHNLVYLHVNYNTFRLAYWALYFLIKCNEARASIMKELKETLGDFETEDIDLSEELMNRLPYLDSFVQETCRMSSGVFIVRHVTESTTIQLGGISFKLRAGDKVAIFPPSIHKDPAMFDQPKEFKHDRFLERTFHKSGRRILSPIMSFGILCPGKKYALLQLKIFIIIMLLRFEMKLNDDDTLHFDESFSGHEVLPPKGDVEIQLSAKNFPSTVDFSDC